MERVILHCDLNSFFASVEQLINPEYRGKAMAVCGDSAERHGIVLAKTEEAKKFGVRTTEPIWSAQSKCRDLIITTPHYEQYAEYSAIVRKIYEDYSDLVESFGCDEAWIDVTGSRRLFGDGYEIAETIRERVKREVGLTISVGVSFSKPFAKLGSDMKKPDAVTIISKENFKEKIWGMNADEMIGVGKKSYALLNKYGIITLGDLANANPRFLKKIMGVGGEALWRFANGTDETPVGNIYNKTDAKSIGRGVTGSTDITGEEDAWKVLCELSREVSHSLYKEGYFAGGVTVSIRHTDFTNKSFQSTFSSPTRSFYEISHKAMELLQQNFNWQIALRSMSVTAINLSRDAMGIQAEFDWNFYHKEKTIKLEDAVEEICRKYGKNSVCPGTFLQIQQRELKPSLFSSLPKAE